MSRRGLMNAVTEPRFVRRLALLALIVATVALLAFGTHAGRADYRGPDENTSQAYGPLHGDTPYTATLNQGGGNPNDQDWYYYYVPKAGVHLHWTISNTNSVTACPLYSCNVYATLEDGKGQQLGGPDSSAGISGAAPGMTQTIDWTFPTPGKYYIAFVGDGPQISYQFSVTPASGVSSTPPSSGGGSTQTHSLQLSAHQRGRDVEISFVSPSAGARLDAQLYTSSGHSLQSAGRLQRSHVPKGRDSYAVQLNTRAWSALKQRHRLTLTLRVKLTPAGGGTLSASRSVVVRH